MYCYAGCSGKGALPEGFFDDPKQDAKARKVEYKDPMTEEWEKFQKTIQKEDDVRTNYIYARTRLCIYIYIYIHTCTCSIKF